MRLYNSIGYWIYIFATSYIIYFICLFLIGKVSIWKSQKTSNIEETEFIMNHATRLTHNSVF